MADQTVLGVYQKHGKIEAPIERSQRELGWKVTLKHMANCEI